LPTGRSGSSSRTKICFWNLVVRETLATPALQIGAVWTSAVAGGDEGVADLVVDGVTDWDYGGDAD
jgi:hypothetical protein